MSIALRSLLLFGVIGIILPCSASPATAADDQSRPRARDLGVVVGVFPTGPFNAITDVAGVRVGHATIIEGDDIRTGVTAIIPATGDLYTNPLPAWIHVGNGYGKLTGSTQVQEFGELETPILLTCTLCVWKASDYLAEWIYSQPGATEHTVNPVVGEINDSVVNNMWASPVRREHVFAALDSASGGPVAEGSVGGGTGSQTYHWKGGIGTSSRVLPDELGGYTVGVLVQSNLLAGATLQMNGAPVGRELNKYAYQDIYASSSMNAINKQDGSIMMVVATDAPLDTRTLGRLAARAIMGLARTGSVAENGSGDYVIAFSTSDAVRRKRESDKPFPTAALLNASMTPLFAATADATEEAIYNALLKATTVTSKRGRLAAIPIAPVREILEKYKVLDWDKTLPPHSHEVTRPTRHTVSADGHPLAVWEKSAPGADEAILLVHGRTWSALPDFDLQVEGEDLSLMDGLVAEGYAVYAVDLRGYGETPRDASGWLTPGRAADDVNIVLEWIAGASEWRTRPHLFGWSMGSTIAQLAAQRQPGNIASLTLYGYWHNPDDQYPADPPGLELAREINTAEAAASDFIVPGSISEKAIDRYVEQALAADPVKTDLRGLSDYNALDASQLTMPTLVIRGEHDPLAAPENIAKLYTRIKSGNKQWVSVPGGDHAAFLESPRAYFIDELVTFLKDAARTEQ